MRLTKHHPTVKRWASRIVRQVRYRARRKSIPFNLDAEHLLSLWTGRCPVFGTPFTFDRQSTDTSPSLDRLRPYRGYVKGNVAIISVRANAMKNNADARLLRRLANWLEVVEWQRKGATV